MNRISKISQHVIATRNVSSKPQDDRLVVTIIGGGNSGHVTCALLKENLKGKVVVQLLTSVPETFSDKKIVCEFPNGTEQVGEIDVVSSDPEALIPQSDVVLWTGPVNRTKAVFERLNGLFDVRKTAVGTIFAQGLSHLVAHRVFGPKVRFFALRNIPWLCRTITKGKRCAIVGPKTSIEANVVNLDETFLKDVIEPMFVTQHVGVWEPVIEQMPDFCPIVFNPANQIIHPARYYGMFRNYSGTPLKGDEAPPEFLYRGMDELSGNVLQALDDELQAIKNAYFKVTGARGCEMVLKLRDRLLLQYGDQIADKSTMAKMVGTNKAYSMAKTPVLRKDGGVMPWPEHRVVQDDIGWGLCVLLSIAHRLEVQGVKTPTTMIKAMIDWHQSLMGKEFMVNGRLTGKDCKDLVLINLDDPLELVANIPSGTDVKQYDEPVINAEDEEERIANP